jgi:hypothetical protein
VGLSDLGWREAWFFNRPLQGPSTADAVGKAPAPSRRQKKSRKESISHIYFATMQALGLVVVLVFLSAVCAEYKLVKEYASDHFFNYFNFYSGDDPTHGYGKLKIEDS